MTIIYLSVFVCGVFKLFLDPVSISICGPCDMYESPWAQLCTYLFKFHEFPLFCVCVCVSGDSQPSLSCAFTHDIPACNLSVNHLHKETRKTDSTSQHDEADSLTFNFALQDMTFMIYVTQIDLKRKVWSISHRCVSQQHLHQFIFCLLWVIL